MLSNEEYKELSIREFNKAAKRYESKPVSVYNLCKEDYPPILEELRREPFETLLDCGCGTAPMLSLLTQEYPDRRYTGLDLSPEMLHRARAKKLPNTEFVEGDSEDMPFEDNSFDVVICSQSFHHYPNPAGFFSQVARVLRPGGRLVLRDFSCEGAMKWIANNIEMPLVHLLGHGDVATYSQAQLRSMAEGAGLRVETLRKDPKLRAHLVARKAQGQSAV